MSKKKKELYKNHVTPKEMEFISDSCVDTIRKHIRNGDIKAKCINGRYYIHAEEVAEWCYFTTKGLNISCLHDVDIVEDRIKFVLKKQVM